MPQCNNTAKAGRTPVFVVPASQAGSRNRFGKTSFRHTWGVPLLAARPLEKRPDWPASCSDKVRAGAIRQAYATRHGAGFDGDHQLWYVKLL